jgi:hypothetical protein
MVGGVDSSLDPEEPQVMNLRMAQQRRPKLRHREGKESARKRKNKEETPAELGRCAQCSPDTQHMWLESQENQERERAGATFKEIMTKFPKTDEQSTSRSGGSKKPEARKTKNIPG